MTDKKDDFTAKQPGFIDKLIKNFYTWLESKQESPNYERVVLFLIGVLFGIAIM